MKIVFWGMLLLCTNIWAETSSIQFDITEAAKEYITAEKAEKMYVTLNLSYENLFKHMRDKIIPIPAKIKIDVQKLGHLTGKVTYGLGYPIIRVHPWKTKRRFRKTLTHEFKHIIYSQMTTQQRSEMFTYR